MTPVSPELTMQAFGAESGRLAQVAEGAGDAAFGRLSPCRPWTAAELLYHVQMTMGRLQAMLAEPEPDGTGLVAAAGYYRADHRFAAAVTEDRIRSAQRGAAALPGAAAPASDFRQARNLTWSLLQAAPAGRVVRTRHGDAMVLAEFARTRGWNWPCMAWTWPPHWTAGPG
jgi:Mycothiol maleylpyruvate isomerase N-terminal domain